MASNSAVERSHNMLAEITGMCDEAEYLLHQDELNYAEAMAFGDKVVAIGNTMRANVAAQMEEPNRTKLPEELQNLPVAMIKKALNELAQPYRASISKPTHFIKIDVADLPGEQVEDLFEQFKIKSQSCWKGLSREEKQAEVDRLILEMRQHNESRKAV